MADIQHLASLTEEDIKFRYITPAIESAGWQKNQIRMEYFFTDGRIISAGSEYERASRKKADYVLQLNNDNLLAVVEAKSATKDVWFYRLDMPEGYKHFSKTKPMRLEHCQPIRDWWNNRTEIITTDEEGNVLDEKSRRFTAQQLIELSCNFDQCKFPKSEEEVLSPAELLADYHKRREALNQQIDKQLEKIQSLLGMKSNKFDYGEQQNNRNSRSVQPSR